MSLVGGVHLLGAVDGMLAVLNAVAEEDNLRLHHRIVMLVQYRAGQRSVRLQSEAETGGILAGADHDRAAAVDVAVEQAVEGHDRLVGGCRRVDEVDHQPRLLARVAAGDAAGPRLGEPARAAPGKALAGSHLQAKDLAEMSAHSLGGFIHWNALAKQFGQRRNAFVAQPAGNNPIEIA